ncbi:MAG: threonylcarbamoyl-AMP synthase [Clostridia bacterium]|nr:threonylcarbamoyl-AMP synthase [Clostridia bacterium]
MKTEIYEIRCVDSEAAQNALARAGDILRRGGLVVFPTETVYGLGADATDATAASRIYTAKGRPSDNPLIVHVEAPEDAQKYAVTNEVYDRLATAFMPGPLTVIMPVKPTIPSTVTAGLSTVAVRCPSHPVARALLCAAGVPIAAPSANLSGSPSPTCARHVAEDMMGRVDMILDGGDSEIGLESTIVKIEEDGSLTLLRPGAVTPSMLMEIVPELHIADAVLAALPEGQTVLSPGMKYRHYAPKTTFILLDGTREQITAYAKKRKGKIGILCYKEDFDFFSTYFPADQCIIWGKREDTREQAKRLFTLLREMDKLSFDCIFAPLPPREEMGMALYNRMIRAAAHQIVHL